MHTDIPRPLFNCVFCTEQMIAIVLLVWVCICVTLASCQAPCKPLPYEVYWNIGTSDPPFNLSQFLIFSSNYTQTGTTCSIAGCKGWTQGLFPSITDDGALINGGVPQNGNLTAHLEKLAATISDWIPDPLWSGNAVLDFESWTTVWELNNAIGWWHGARYQNYSIYLETLKHPEWNETQIYEAAKSEFEAAATAYFVETLNVLRKARPNAKWGYYGLPINLFVPCEGSGEDMKCGYDSSQGDLYRSFSDRQMPIWEASTALYPSIYFQPFRTTFENIAYVQSVIKETVRCSEGKIPVYAFHWNYYHNATTLLDPEDLFSGLVGPYDQKSQGVIMWGNTEEQQDAAFLEYAEENVGPIILEFLNNMCQCSTYYCGGNGRCMPSSADTCQMYPSKR